MPPAEEARVIDLMTQCLEQTAIAQALGIPRGTVSSRAMVLVAQGKIQPRPRGGAYPRQRAQQ
jgi:DNA-binding IclR family transcriptional regulator